MWLAVGLAQDLLEADVIQWATTKKDINEQNSIFQGQVNDWHTVQGILLDRTSLTGDHLEDNNFNNLASKVEITDLEALFVT